MRKQSLYISSGLHIAVFIIATVSLPWLKRDFVIPQPITVELAEVSKTAQTTRVAPRPVPKPEKKKEEDKPPPAAQNTADEPAPPVKEPKKEDDKKEEKKQLVDKNALPDKKKKDDKKKKTTEEKPKKDFSSVLKNLDVKKEDKAPDKQPDLDPNEKKAAPEGQNAPLGEKLTMSEEDALKRQLEKCWNVPIGAKDVENMAVDIYMVINRDGTLQSARIVDTGRYNSDTFYRALADSAMRAVRSPLCSPFDLPPDKYDTWKETSITFNPTDMF